MSEAETARSIWPAVATTVVALAILFAGLASGVAAEILSVAVMTVPDGVARGTPRTSGKVAVPPEARLAMVQVTVPPEVPTPGSGAQFQPAGTTID